MHVAWQQHIYCRPEAAQNGSDAKIAMDRTIGGKAKRNEDGDANSLLLSDFAGRTLRDVGIAAAWEEGKVDR